MRVSKQFAVNLQTLGFEYLGDGTHVHGAQVWSALGHGRVVRGLSPGFLLQACEKVKVKGGTALSPEILPSPEDAYDR